MVLDVRAQGQANRTAQVTHGVGTEEVMKPKLHTPKNSGGEHTHEAVEDEQARVVSEVVCFETKHVFFLEHVLDGKAYRRASQHRYRNRIRAAVRPHRHCLRANVGRSGQSRHQGIDQGDASG